MADIVIDLIHEHFPESGNELSVFQHQPQPGCMPEKILALAAVGFLGRDFDLDFKNAAVTGGYHGYRTGFEVADPVLGLDTFDHFGFFNIHFDQIPGVGCLGLGFWNSDFQ